MTDNTEREQFIQWLSTTYPLAYTRTEAACLWADKHIGALAWQAARATLPKPTATPAAEGLTAALDALDEFESAHCDAMHDQSTAFDMKASKEAKAKVQNAIRALAASQVSMSDTRILEQLRRDALRYRWLARKVSAHGVIDGWAFGFPTHLTLPAPVHAMHDPEAALGEAIDAAIAAAPQKGGA